jgi:hypothetical protein
MVIVQSASHYDAKAIRLLSGVMFDVKRTVEGSSGAPLSETENVQVTRAIADWLMRGFDLGERNHDALRLAAMDGLAMTLANVKCDPPAGIED